MSGDRLQGSVAATLALHRIHDRRPGEVTCWACLPDGWMNGETYFRHLADAVLPVVQARIDAAREQVAEQIAQAIETAASKWADDLYTSALEMAARIARQHAKGTGNG